MAESPPGTSKLLRRARAENLEFLRSFRRHNLQQLRELRSSKRAGRGRGRQQL